MSPGRGDAPLASPTPSFGARTWLAAGAGIAAALLLVAGDERLRPKSAVELPVRKLELAVEGFSFSMFGKSPAIAPGGERILYDAAGRLFVRELSGLQARELPQSEDALYPSWSPDGRRVAYIHGEGSGRSRSTAASRPRSAPCRRISPAPAARPGARTA